MGKDKKTPITIDEKQYDFEDMNAEQQTIINHLIDLDRKISSARFNLDQLEVGKEAFLTRLKAALDSNPPAAEAVEVVQ